MPSIRIFLPVALGTLFLIAAPVAQAQSGDTPPAARALLPASVLATLLQNSVHMTGAIDISVGGLPAGSVDISGDAAWQDQAEGSFHLNSSSPLVTAALGAATADAIFVGQKAAARVGAKPWQCSSAATRPSGAAGTTAKPKTAKGKSKSHARSRKKGTKSGKSVSGSASGSPGTAMSGAISAEALPHFGQPVDLGAESLGGIPVWHVQAKSAETTTGAASLDLYITQSDLTVKRVVLNATTTSSPAATVAATIDLSQYGEPVSVTLPDACASANAVSSSAQRGWAATLSALFQQRGLLALLSR